MNFKHVSAHQRQENAKFHQNSKIAKLVVTTDLALHKSFSMNLSGTSGRNPRNLDISKPKLTSGYRKRLSGSRAGSQNVTEMPENPVTMFSASRPGPLEYYLDGGYLNRLDKSYYLDGGCLNRLDKSHTLPPNDTVTKNHHGDEFRNWPDQTRCKELHEFEYGTNNGTIQRYNHQNLENC